MSLYEKVPASVNFVEREKQTEKFWHDNDIFRKSMEQRKGDKTYTFYDGPPTANGKPHIGHVLTRVIKDMIPRYRTMKGYDVPRKAGWDTHGLPVELEVEKTLGLDGKPQIEQYGIEPFEYNPMQVKQAVVGYGGAEKRQVIEMTTRLLRLAAPPRPDDVADALAIAICHAHSRPASGRKIR